MSVKEEDDSVIALHNAHFQILEQNIYSAVIAFFQEL
jgi:hypothetical protein